MSRLGHWIDHTPMCPKDCLVKHHELVLALSSSSMSTADLDCCIQDQVKRGWDVDSDIPDPLPELQRPILYLAASFCFIRVLRYLLERFQLKAAVQSTKGESALHGMIKHAYHTLRTSRPDCRRKVEAVTKMLQTLTNHDPKILLVKDYAENQTPLLFAAKSFVDLESTATEALRRKRIPPQENFYAGCVEAILGNMCNLYEKGNISKDDLSEALLSPDCRGFNILHVLAQSTHEKARIIFRRVVEFSGFVSNETDVLYLKNNAGKTVTDLVLEHQHAAAWLNKLDYEEEGPPTMVDMHPLKQEGYDDSDSASVTDDISNGQIKLGSNRSQILKINKLSSELVSTASNTVTVQPSMPHAEVIYYNSPLVIAGTSHTNESSELHTTTASPTELIKEKYNQTTGNSAEGVVGTSFKTLYEEQTASSSGESHSQNTEQTDAFLKLIMHDNYGLDPVGQIGMLDILQQGLKRKLSQVEDSVKATDDEIENFEEAIRTENNEVEELERRLAELKQIVSKHSTVIQEKKRKLRSLSMEELKLRKKIKSCEEARNDIACKSFKKEVSEN